MIIRLAEQRDLEQIEILMKSSMLVLGIGHYSQEQIESCRRFVCVPDRQLIEDGTYFVVVEESGKMVGCGGWSFRNKLYAGPKNQVITDDRLNPSTDPARIRAMFTDPDSGGKGIGSLILAHSEKAAKERGFSKGILGSTVSGLSFYKAKGWEEVAEEESLLPDGVPIRVIQMIKYFN